MVFSWADQLLPQLLMERFDTLPIQYRNIEHMHEGVWLNKTNSTNLYPLTKDYLRETCKSQNINPIYLTLSSTSVSFRS